MRVPAWAFLLLLSACATPVPPPPKAPVSYGSTAANLPLANLRRAVALPWKDQGRCVVAAAANPWPVVVDRCFQALDRQKLRFRDVQHRCPVASADAATVQAMVGFCLLVQPELVVGAVVVVSAFVVAVAIVQAIDAYELRQREKATRKKPTPGPVVTPTPERVPDPGPQPKPDPLGPDFIQSSPDVTDRGPECRPRAVPHRGGNDEANRCADRIPGNGYPGWDVLVNGKHFDALQPAARVLWEVKAYHFDDYPPYVRKVVIPKQVDELRAERALAHACGYHYTVGVLSAAHREALREFDDSLDIVVMDWC